MNKNEIIYMIGQISDDYLQESEYKINKKRFRNVKLIPIFSCVFFIVFAAILLYPFIKNQYTTNHKTSLEAGCTLPGAGEIYPAVMYQGKIYSWQRISLDTVLDLPEGVLPDGYQYAGNIEYSDSKEPKKDYQFVAKFKATGKLYYNTNDPNTVCICITTYWLENSYVLFHLDE